MNEKVKIYSIDEVLDSIGGYIDCSEFMDYEEDYQYSNIVYYLEKYKEQQQEIERLNNIINELEKYVNKLMGQTRTAIAFNKDINDVYETKKYERDNDLFEMILDKLKALKESNK